MRHEFPTDYLLARQRFRSAAGAAGARLEAHPIGQSGPDGEDLTIDVAMLGDERPSRAVVVSSGLHGVEAPLGSAIQAAILGADRPFALPAGAAVVLVHVLNPFGFAWARRFDAGNVDLNRNFLLDGEEYAGSPATYAELDWLLNPPRPPRRFDGFYYGSARAIVRHGMPALKQAVAGGQYEFPRGLFFGGEGPSPTLRIVAEHLPRWVGEADPIVHLDVHTGLGRWAVGKLLLTDALRAHRAWLASAFGDEFVESADPRQADYRARGDLLTWCERQLFADRRYVGLCAEFGTYWPLRVTAALRAENQAHHWGRPDDPATARAKRRLAEVFAPADRRWQDACFRQGLEMVRRALGACFALESPPEAAEASSLHPPEG